MTNNWRTIIEYDCFLSTGWKKYLIGSRLSIFSFQCPVCVMCVSYMFFRFSKLHYISFIFSQLPFSLIEHIIFIFTYNHKLQMSVTLLTLSKSSQTQIAVNCEVFKIFERNLKVALVYRKTILCFLNTKIAFLENLCGWLEENREEPQVVLCICQRGWLDSSSPPAESLQT